MLGHDTTPQQLLFADASELQCVRRFAAENDLGRRRGQRPYLFSHGSGSLDSAPSLAIQTETHPPLLSATAHAAYTTVRLAATTPLLSFCPDAHFCTRSRPLDARAGPRVGCPLLAVSCALLKHEQCRAAIRRPLSLLDLHRPVEPATSRLPDITCLRPC